MGIRERCREGGFKSNWSCIARKSSGDRVLVIREEFTLLAILRIDHNRHRPINLRALLSYRAKSRGLNWFARSAACRAMNDFVKPGSLSQAGPRECRRDDFLSSCLREA
jgi:hypothetical protein